MSGSIIRRGKRSWRCKFEIGRGADGRRQTRYLTVRGTRKDAEKAMIDALKAASDGTFVDASKLTVGEYLEKWLTDYAATAVAAKTFERYAEIVRIHLVPGLGAIALKNLKPLDIQSYYARALASGRIKGGALSPRTVHHHHVILSQALARAVKWRLLAINPAEAVDPPRVHQQEIEVLDDDELATLLRSAQDTRSYPAILLAATTGMRRGEVLGLRWRDLDLDGAKLTVAVSLEETKSGLRVKAPKTRSSKRTITLPAVTVEALRRHRAQVLRERLTLGLGRDDKGPVFANLEGEHIRPKSFTREFGRIVKRASAIDHPPWVAAFAHHQPAPRRGQREGGQRTCRPCVGRDHPGPVWTCAPRHASRGRGQGRRRASGRSRRMNRKRPGANRVPIRDILTQRPTVSS